jgi:hypothetical protein
MNNAMPSGDLARVAGTLLSVWGIAAIPVEID